VEEPELCAGMCFHVCHAGQGIRSRGETGAGTDEDHEAEVRAYCRACEGEAYGWRARAQRGEAGRGNRNEEAEAVHAPVACDIYGRIPLVPSLVVHCTDVRLAGI
jgi:hypothetical protein